MKTPLLVTVIALTLTVSAVGCGGPAAATSPAAAAASPTPCPSQPAGGSPRPRPSGAPSGSGFGGRAGAPAATGAVTAVKAGGRLTVQDRRSGSEVEVLTDASTEVRINGAPGKLSSIKVGSNVVVVGTRQADGSVLATSIQVVTGGCFGGRRGLPSGAPTARTT